MADTPMLGSATPAPADSASAEASNSVGGRQAELDAAPYTRCSCPRT